MFDVFYWGPKPNLFEFERPAETLEHAAELCRTGYYWYIYGGNDYTGFDFEWRPAPWEAHQLHSFPSQWQRTGGVYFANKSTAANREYNFRTEQQVRRLPDPTQWRIPDGIDDTGFDYSWHPDATEAPYEYHFGTQWQRNGGPVYPGTAGYKPVVGQRVRKLPDRSCWRIPDNIDDSEFDYSWHPDLTEPDYEYHFPTQWQREGGPVYPGTAGIKYMTDQRIRAGATQIFYMDFMNGPIARHQYDVLKLDHPDIKLTRYVDSHLNVFKRIMKLATTEYVWIISSVCDYTQFDFTWHPSEAQREMIHCFPSGNQPRGDTFYIHVPSFTQQMIDLELLDWFNVINYCDDQMVDRFQTPTHQYSSDDLVGEIKRYEFRTPYVLFTNQKDLQFADSPCLWTKKDRTVLRASRAGATALIPRDIKEDLVSQIYDYPYIEESNYRVNDYFSDRDFPELDIVYISNGEPDEERWYNHLCYMSNNTKIHWVRGINGRVQAYQAAARASRTPWFFAVFAKLEVVSFDWNWMPDMFQEPKHYIFNSHNPVNGLEYGHQGMICYNKRLVLENTAPGIDFTLSQPHEAVPILSGIAHFNQSEWMTWRTAFREVIKLKHFMATEPTLETSHRLATWATVAEGDFAEWSIRGTQDAIAYYNEVGGDYNRLMLSFEWAWLQERFNAGNL